MIFDYTFKIVLLGTTIIGALCAILGTYMVLRKEALIGDGIAHVSYPGIILAFMVLGVKDLEGLLLGAYLSALLAISLILAAKNYTKLPFDGVLAAVLSSFFGLGLVFMTIVQRSNNANQAGLNSFIFGQASTILYKDVIFSLILGCLVLLVIGYYWKEFKIICFDPDYARTIGIPVKIFTGILNFLVITVVLLALQSVGIILMSSLLIAPAVSARLWTRRIEGTIIVAALFGAVASASGTIISSSFAKIPTGPSIVVSISLIAIVSILLAPQRGLISKIMERQKLRGGL